MGLMTEDKALEVQKKVWASANTKGADLVPHHLVVDCEARLQEMVRMARLGDILAIRPGMLFTLENALRCVQELKGKK
jgi:hypothetical protein